MKLTEEQIQESMNDNPLHNQAAVDYARQIVEHQEALLKKALDIHAEEVWTLESLQGRVQAVSMQDDPEKLEYYQLDGKTILVMKKPEFVGETPACEIYYKIMEKDHASKQGND